MPAGAASSCPRTRSLTGCAARERVSTWVLSGTAPWPGHWSQELFKKAPSALSWLMPTGEHDASVARTERSASFARRPRSKGVRSRTVTRLRKRCACGPRARSIGRMKSRALRPATGAAAVTSRASPHTRASKGARAHLHRRGSGRGPDCAAFHSAGGSEGPPQKTWIFAVPYHWLMPVSSSTATSNSQSELSGRPWTTFLWVGDVPKSWMVFQPSCEPLQW